ncbi:hypothetical protein BDY19DRAFT_886832 [Irpex rosettiformis]|uniref:Uncharacterized protein n=1 Tax=Irpex rosettiformis TaxID=378272 RepID=A0ACB8U9X1_9APHY|nr:hypothetical protein BDY19DRAFT_886832 [Irpex rosettiformis]
MSAIPASLSFLASMASNYPPFQKAVQGMAPPTGGFQFPQYSTPAGNPAVTQPPQNNAGTQLPSSAPVSIPQATTTTQSPASSPPTGTHATTSNLCENCHVRPKFVDPSTTKPHPYCSKSCANVAKQKASKLCPVSVSTSVKQECHARPKRVDGTRTHDYCSKSCAQKAASHSGPQSGINPNPHGKICTCQIPGCSKPAHKNTNGSMGRYCGLAHKSLAEKACLYCRKVQKLGDRHFCSSACADEAVKKGPMLLEMSEDHETFKSVEAQFKTSWRHAGRPCPPVRYIYKIVSDKASLDKYNTYRDTVEARGQFKANGRSPGNENRRWHGTKRECQLGDKGHTNFCSSSACSLCCIMKTSFDVHLWGKKTGWGRFGAGIYTSSTSSKASDYSQNTDLNAPLKAIFLNKVIVGRGYKMTQDNTSLTAPPAGFDSVLAEKGARLNHDELVVYCNEAIRPSYLVMYDAH